MPHIVRMPELITGSNEAAIAGWLVEVGDAVAAGQGIVEIETEKATVEYEAETDGVLAEILLQPGDTVPVGTPIAVLAVGGESVDDAVAAAGPAVGGAAGAGAGAGGAGAGGAGAGGAGAGGASAAPGSAAEDEVVQDAGSQDGEARGAVVTVAQGSAVAPSATEPSAAAPTAAAEPNVAAPSAAAQSAAQPEHRRFASPLVRKLARERGLDLSGVIGSGPGGRIVRRDIEGRTAPGAGAAAGATASAGGAATAASAIGGASASAPGEQPGAQPGAQATAASSTPASSTAAQPAAAPAGTAAPAAAAAGAGAAAPAAAPAAAAAASSTPASSTGPSSAQPGTGASAAAYTEVPHTGMRRAIARRLSESKATIPHYYLVAHVEMDALLALRKQVNALAGVKVSVNDFVVKAVAAALVDVPEANAIWTDTAMRRFTSADIAIAVAVPGGLLTPVVRGVERMSLTALSAATRDVAERARDGKLKQHELEGGSFSVSNLGMYGIPEFSAIINPPHAGILAVGAAEKRPVVRENGELAVATMMTVTLSADHRVIDGALGAQWLAALKTRIEQPLTLLV